MTEQNKRPDERGAEPPAGRCDFGWRVNPCWREATEPRRPGGEELVVCAEHARLLDIGEEEDAWAYALEAIQDWFNGPVSRDPHGELERLAWKVRDEAREQYAHAHTKAEVAKLLAEQGPPEEGEPRLTFEQGEELTRLIIRADSFNDARSVLENVPEEVFGRQDKWATISTIVDASEEANEEARRYKREIGLAD